MPIFVHLNTLFVIQYEHKFIFKLQLGREGLK